jgi:hypothetical protein
VHATNSTVLGNEEVESGKSMSVRIENGGRNVFLGEAKDTPVAVAAAAALLPGIFKQGAAQVEIDVIAADAMPRFGRTLPPGTPRSAIPQTAADSRQKRTESKSAVTRDGKGRSHASHLVQVS